MQSQGSCVDCIAGYVPGNATTCAACPPGYYSSSGDTTCTPCPAGTYAPAEGSSVCVTCGGNEWSDAGEASCQPCAPVGMLCVKGVRTFLPNYWRGYSDWNVSKVSSTTVFLPCDPNACNTSSNGDVSCIGHHTGPLCSLCADGFASNPSGGCFSCPSRGAATAVLVLVATVASSSVLLLVVKSSTAPPSRKAKPLLIFKIFVNYIQVGPRPPWLLLLRQW